MAITKAQALQRTKRMLKREWVLESEPKAGTSLRNWPDGLGKNDDEIAGLKRPIETVDFEDVKTKVEEEALTEAETVAGLRDKIWEGTP